LVERSIRYDALEKVRNDPRSTPARILDAAEEVLAHQGYRAASTRTIAKRAGVPLGAVHYHWGTKDGLRQAVYYRMVERLRDTLVRSWVPATTPGENIAKMVDAFFDLLIANPNAVFMLYRNVVEPRDRLSDDLFAALATMGVSLTKEMGLEDRIDGAAAAFIVSGAFLTSLANQVGQEMFLGGNVFTSRVARERLRSALQRMARCLFAIPE
jgi:AcrR family transcriptional regulator